MPFGRMNKKALMQGAFFIFTFLVLTSAHGNDTGCNQQAFDRTVTVTHVYDGDTFSIESGEKIRLIGINTPEIARDNKPDQPLAIEARERLSEILKDSDFRVGLKFDKDLADKYKRLLAHVYLPDGSNIQQRLLEEGLAAHIAIPPNLTHLECYANSEKLARKSYKGMWQVAAYAYRETTALGPDDTGFHLVQGRVTHISESRNALWINLEGKTALRISRKNLHYFNRNMLENITGKKVQARGWLIYNKKRKELFMPTHHPASLGIVEK